VILIGIGRFGDAIAREVLAEGKKLLAVDFNPESVRAWRARGLDAVYGDASDPEFLGQLPLEHAQWVISALPQHETGVTHEDPRLTLIDGLRSAGYRGHIAVATHKLDEVEILEAKGAKTVMLPFQDAASKAVSQILR
jgi:K+ transport systems, NAD-binding component